MQVKMVNKKSSVVNVTVHLLCRPVINSLPQSLMKQY